MLKRLIFILAIASFITSCGNQKVYDVTSFLSEADNLVGKEIAIKGTVTHVCRHSGQKCFIKADGSDGTLRIEADGEIKSFSNELIDKEIIVLGSVREDRIDKAEIENDEKALNEKKLEATDEEAKEHCAMEQKNIDDMKKWMKNHGKDYYAIYYIEGIKKLK